MIFFLLFLYHILILFYISFQFSSFVLILLSLHNILHLFLFSLQVSSSSALSVLAGACHVLVSCIAIATTITKGKGTNKLQNGHFPQYRRRRLRACKVGFCCCSLYSFFLPRDRLEWAFTQGMSRWCKVRLGGFLAASVIAWRAWGGLGVAEVRRDWIVSPRNIDALDKQCSFMPLFSLELLSYCTLLVFFISAQSYLNIKQIPMPSICQKALLTGISFTCLTI